MARIMLKPFGDPVGQNVAHKASAFSLNCNCVRFDDTKMGLGGTAQSSKQTATPSTCKTSAVRDHDLQWLMPISRR
jgi:hypothetical protein